MKIRRLFLRVQAITLALMFTFVFVAQARPQAADVLPGFAETRNLSGLTTDSLSIAIGDINGDGSPDAITGASNNTLWLSLNDGVGYFPSATQIGAESSPVLSIRLADLDGDGDLDLVGATANKLFTYKNSAGQFGGYAAVGPVEGTLNILSFELADTNNDSRPDIIMGTFAGQSAVFLNNGSGSFYYGTLVCGSSPSQFRCFGNGTQAPGALQIGDIDGDADVDIITGRSLYTQTSYVYFNDSNGNFAAGATLPSPTFNIIHTLAFGDLNGDGLLDVVSGEENTNTTNGALYAYLNTGGGTFANPVQIGETLLPTQIGRPTLLDIDLDGDLDILFSLLNKHVAFLNDGAGSFLNGAMDCNTPPNNAFCFARGADYIKNLTAVDIDTDGDLDLVAIHSNNSNILYINNGSATLKRGAGVEVSSLNAQPTSLALGDMNGDGWLDVVAGTDNGASILLNQGNGSLALGPALASGENYNDLNIADLDGDHDLDILASLANNYLVIFFNDGGSFFTGALDCDNPNITCLGSLSDDNLNAATGDVDGDGDLDILANRSLGARTLYLNDGSGGFGNIRPFAFPAVGASGDVALADLDIDGDLDAILVQSIATPGYVYLNDGQGNFSTGVVNCATPPAGVRCFDGGKGTSLSTADLNADGYLDIVVGKDTGQSRLYLNDGRGNFGWPGAGHSFGGMETTHGIATLDADGDGDLDIAAANGSGQIDTIYLNDGAGTFGSLAQAHQFGSSTDILDKVAGGDINRDGMLDLVTLEYDPQAARTLVAVATNYTRSARGAARLPDNPPYIRLNHPGTTPQAEGYASAEVLNTSQISFNYTLFDPQGNKVSRIAVYFSPDGGGKWYPALPAAGTPTTNLAAAPSGSQHTYTWDTAASGFFGKSDRVVLRMLAYSTTYPTPWSYSSALTLPFRMHGMQVRVMQGAQPVSGAVVLRSSAGGSFEPIRDGAGSPQITNANGYLEGRGALQTGDGLVALWLVEQHPAYAVYYSNITPTQQGATGLSVSSFGVQTIQISSQHPLVLFNLTISLQWDARNDPAYLDRLRYDLETASQRLFDWSNGQIALGKLTVYQARGQWNDALVRIYANNRFRPTAMKGGIVPSATTDPATSTIIYSPGQIHIGAVWNRYGTPGNNLEQDWPRALAHEVNHFALFMDDNYLGLDENGNIIPVDSCPSVMTDPYRKDYPYDEYHPALNWDVECGQTLSNRLTGRSDWETLSTFYPWITFNSVNSGPNGQPLAITEISFVDPQGASSALADPTFYLAEGGVRVEPGRQSRAFLFQDNWAIDLGKPITDHVLARGARPGDRVCLYEPQAGRVGCETVSAGDELISLSTFSDWQPQVIVSPVSSTTIQITVNDLPAGMALSARLYPMMGPAAAGQALTFASGSYTTTFNLAEPAAEGYVLVYVNESEPRREAIVDYAIGGSPSNIRGSNSNIRGSNAPASSTDGQVILFTPDTQLDENEFYTLQALSQAPELPSWAGMASRPYRIAASLGATSLAGSSITFSYMGDEVQNGEEDWLKIYFWDGSAWQPLPTRLDTYFNTASAPAEQPGIYILLSSVEIQLTAGWNLVSYPLQVNLPVEAAFSSLSDLPGLTAYSYTPNASDPWKLYSPSAPAWVNDMTTLVEGQGCWIYTTQNATWRLSGGMTAAARDAQPANMPIPPATIYGWVKSGWGYTPTLGAPISAYAETTLCAQTNIFQVGGELVYLLEVPDGASCGAGHTLTFRSGETPMPETTPWSNQSPTRLDFFNLKYLYLPALTK